MRFFVIYSFECPREHSVKRHLPTNRHLWQQTEGDEQRELDEVFPNGKHRKLTATLTRKQFDAFIGYAGLYAESTQTMGSVTGMGWMPAISFRSDDSEAYLSAYVTPIPDVDIVNRQDDEEWSDRCWERVRRAVISVYGV